LLAWTMTVMKASMPLSVFPGSAFTADFVSLAADNAETAFATRAAVALSFWDRCYDFLNIFAKKSANQLAFLTQNKAKLCKFVIIKLVFEKNANVFAKNSRKL
jgi:hypothetical protein